MEEIAHEAGFGKATLYYYFASKEEVFSAIMVKGWKSLWEGIEDTIHGDLGPRETFLQVLNNIVAIIMTDRNLYEFLFTAPKTITHMPEGVQTWRTYQNRLYDALRGLVEDGMAKGEFPQLDSELLFRAIGGLFHGLLFLGEQREKVSEKEIEELLSKLIAVPTAGSKG